MYQNTTGQVIGGSILAAGITTLPYTGHSQLGNVLLVISVVAGITIVVSLIVLRILKKLMLS